MLGGPFGVSKMEPWWWLSARHGPPHGCVIAQVSTPFPSGIRQPWAVPALALGICPQVMLTDHPRSPSEAGAWGKTLIAHLLLEAPGPRGEEPASGGTLANCTGGLCGADSGGPFKVGCMIHPVFCLDSGTLALCFLGPDSSQPLPSVLPGQ